MWDMLLRFYNLLHRQERTASLLQQDKCGNTGGDQPREGKEGGNPGLYKPPILVPPSPGGASNNPLLFNPLPNDGWCGPGQCEVLKMPDGSPYSQAPHQVGQYGVPSPAAVSREIDGDGFWCADRWCSNYYGAGAFPQYRLKGLTQTQPGLQIANFPSNWVGAEDGLKWAAGPKYTVCNDADCADSVPPASTPVAAEG